MSYVSDLWAPGSQPPLDDRWVLVVLRGRGNLMNSQAKSILQRVWFDRDQGKWWFAGGGFTVSDEIAWWHPIPYTPDEVVAGVGGW